MPSTRIEPGTPAAAIVEEEEKLLARVRTHLATVDGDGEPIADYDAELIELRDAIGEAKPEDVAPLVEQMARLQAIAARRGRSRTVPVDPATPYFAHMRLREGERVRDVLIGKRGFVTRTPAGEPINIVDWRNAPVSRIYYRYDEGDDYDEAFDGHHLRGIVETRRNITIVKGVLRRIGAGEATLVKDARGVWHEATGASRPILQGGQGTAARPPRPAPPARDGKGAKNGRGPRLGVHGGPVPRADKHLPEIAALIDRDQFDLITSPTSGLVLIQGGAGSGKTTVALHRVAFLSFADPQRFRAKKMLVMVPSHALAQYVAGVLPSLGVPDVRVHTWRGWAGALRRRLLPGGDEAQAYADDTPDAVAKIKKHPALLHLIEAAVVDLAAAFGRELAAELAGADGAGPIAGRWEQLASRPLVPRCRKMIVWLEKQQDLPAATKHRAEAALRRLRRRAGDVMRLFAEILTDAALLRAGFDRHKDSGESGALPVTDGEIAATVKWVARQRDEQAGQDYEGIDPDRLEGVDGRQIDEESGAPVAGRLDPEDDALILRLLQLVHGGLIDKEGHETQFEHIAIDEAQDFSAVQIKVLLEATTNQRCVTIAGDSAQRLVFDNSFHGWDHLLRDAGHLAALVKPLRISYRSTAEVMRFARAILGPLAEQEVPLVARNGAPVSLYPFTELGEAVAFLGEALRSLASREPTASVAVIARHAEQAELVHTALSTAEVPALRRVRREDFTFTPGVDVTDVAQVKGLEFDYVVLMDVTAANYPDSVEARHMLHIGATRAAHQLWLITTAAPSPLLPADLLAEAQA